MIDKKYKNNKKRNVTTKKCICVCVYVYMCVCVYVYMCVCVYVCYVVCKRLIIRGLMRIDEIGEEGKKRY